MDFFYIVHSYATYYNIFLYLLYYYIFLRNHNKIEKSIKCMTYDLCLLLYSLMYKLLFYFPVLLHPNIIYIHNLLIHSFVLYYIYYIFISYYIITTTFNNGKCKYNLIYIYFKLGKNSFTKTIYPMLQISIYNVYNSYHFIFY